MNSQDRARLKGINEGFYTSSTTFFDDPESAIIEPGVMLLDNTHIGRGCHIETGARLESVRIGQNCRIEAGVRLKNVRCGDNCTFVAGAKLTDVNVGNGCTIGAEMKRSAVGNYVNAVHGSTYLGDTTIDHGVNVGAGVITANFDGKNKKKTRIGKDSFIGVGVTLVARHPQLIIGNRTFIAAGVVIRADVPNDTYVDPTGTFRPNEMKKAGNHWIRERPE